MAGRISRGNGPIYAYTLAGNLIYKSDLGTLTYPTQVPGAVRPHAVTSANGVSYTYDNNGNQYQASGRRSVTYSSFNKPTQIVRIPDQLTRSQFAYGPDRELVRHWERDSNPATPPATRIHVGDLYERSTAGSYVEHRYSIRAGDALVAIQKDTTSGPELRYVHRDHLGSTDVLSKDTSPATVDRWLSFDPWGRRRNPNWSDPGAPYSFGFEGGVGKELTPEFTGHTALDHFDLVHMGGRVYDPVLGRVLSPDPFLPAWDSTQGLNRYSYVLNNPLSITDPSGYFGDGGNVSFGSDVGFGGSSVLGPGVLFQFESFPVLQGAPSSGSVGEASSFSFNVEFSASGLQPGVSQHPFGFIFGSFAEGAFSVFQLPLPTFHPLASLNPNPAIIHFILTEPFGLPAPIPLDVQMRFRVAFAEPFAEPKVRLPPCPSTPTGPCRHVSMDTWFGPDIFVGGGVGGTVRKGAARVAPPLANDAARGVARGAARSLDDLSSLRGATTREIDELIPEGFVKSATRKGGGTRYLNPERPGESIRIMRGNPRDPSSIKRGPYLRISRDGRVSDPIPLEGNPTLP